MNENESFTSVLVKTCVASAAISAASTGGMVLGLMAVGHLINRVNEKKQK